MPSDGSLISSSASRALSSKLCQLADECPEIWNELDESRHGLPARTFRDAIREFSGEEAYGSVVRYWIEYAKERLASLVGPMDILAGKLPAVTAYRSAFLDGLRNDAKAGCLKSVGTIVSPQIEPTLKRYVELLPDDPFRKDVLERIRKARRDAVSALSLTERTDFVALKAKERHQLLIERYSQTLEPAGFRLQSRRKGAVYRKNVSDAPWALVFIDESQDGVEGGLLATRMALTLTKKAVLAGAVPLSSVATFSPLDIVPGFGASCGFERASYAQFGLACDANSELALTVYRRLNRLLPES
jgi:hypothetical protein